MQFVVHGHHLDLTEALKERCRGQIFERAQRLVTDSAARLEVELSDKYGVKQRGADKACRVNLRAPGLGPITVTEVRQNMYEAIDVAADRLLEALRRGLARRENYSRESIKNLEPALFHEREDGASTAARE